MGVSNTASILGCCSHLLSDGHATRAVERHLETRQPRHRFCTASKRRNSWAVDSVGRTASQPNRVEFADISDRFPAAGLGNNRTIEQQFVSKHRPCGLAQPLGANAGFASAPVESLYQPSTDQSSNEIGGPSVQWPAPPRVPLSGPDGWYYPEPTPPAPPDDFRTRLREALSDKNLRYYAG